MAIRAEENLEIVRARTDETVDAYINWAEGHTNDVIEVRGYDPERNPDQRLETVSLEPAPDLAVARRWGMAGLGPETYQKLITGLRDIGAISLLERNLAEDKSTLFATAHLRDTLDTAISHNALFVAVGRPEFAKRNIIIANSMMKFLNIGGVAVPEVLSYSGRVIFGSPTKGSQDKSVPAEVAAAINRLASPEITLALSEGAAIHRAMTGTRAKDIVCPDGRPAKMVPRIEDDSTRSVVKRMPDAIGIAMDTAEFGLGKAALVGPVRIESREQVHDFMQDLVEANAAISGEQVFYGLPAGARQS